MREALHEGHARRAARWLWSRGRAAVGLPALVWPVAVAFAGVWLQKGDVAATRLLRPGPASSFLTAIWEVEAVALALSVAVIIFGLQFFFASRHSSIPGSWSDFVAGSGLFVVVGIGVASLLLPAFVLLGYGNGAPGGWAATWCSGVCVAGLAAIPVAFVLTIRSVHPRRLEHQRNERLRRIVDRTVERELFERVAAHRQAELLDGNGMQNLSIRLPEVKAGLHLVRAEKSGVVRDLRLRQIEKLAGPVGTDQPRAALMVRIGSLVSENSSLAVVPNRGDRDVKRERRIVKVRPTTDPEDLLAAQVRSLHDDAVNAIREGRVASLERVAEGYRTLLLAAPLAWDRYEVRFTEGLASGIGPHELGWIELAERRIFEELRAVIRGSSEDIGQVMTSLIYGVAATAVPLGATALVTGMMQLLVAGYEVATLGEQTRAAVSVARACKAGVFELLHYYVIPQAQYEGTGRLPWSASSDLLLKASEVAAQLMKAAATVGGPAEAADVDSRWNSQFALWRPDIATPNEAVIALRALQQGDDDEYVVEGRAALDKASRDEGLLTELGDQRSTFRFELATWLLRRIRRSDGARTDDIEMFQQTVRYFSDVRELVAASGRALDATWSHRPGHLQQWVWQEVADASVGHGPVASPNVEGDLMACFVVLLLMQTGPQSGPPPFPANEWLVTRLDAYCSALDALYSDPALLEEMGLDRIDERVDRAFGALHGAVAEVHRAEQLRIAEAIPDPALVTEFTANVRKSFEANRVAAYAFRATGTFATTDAPAPDGAQRFLVLYGMDKSTFLPDNPVMNPEFSAFEAGRRAAILETDFLVGELMRLSTEFVTPEGTAAEAIRQLVSAMRDEGRTPSVLMTSYDWRLFEQLGLDSTNAAEPPLPVPEGMPHCYRGFFDGLLVIDWPKLLRGQALILDAGEFATWRQYVGTDGGELQVEVDFFDQALSLTSSEDAAEADLKSSGRAQARVWTCWMLEVKDISAARRLRLPKEGVGDVAA